MCVSRVHAAILASIGRLNISLARKRASTTTFPGNRMAAKKIDALRPRPGAGDGNAFRSAARLMAAIDANDAWEVIEDEESRSFNYFLDMGDADEGVNSQAGS